MNLAAILDQEILPLVEKPSRYLGDEVNAVRKNRGEVDVRLALAFPDLYDLGLGNLGVHILYSCVNKLPWAWCERLYAPALDMERELRARDLPLFGLESKDSVADFDGIGFTLQSELTYTNILNLIDLAGIPLRTQDRGEDHPLTFAGGPAVFNPEPIAPFMDFFVIGDGEDAILEIVQLLRRLKGRPRAEKLRALSLLEGVYVPALYPFETLEDGRILPVQDAPKVRKRITRDLNGATFPVDYIVPFTQQVHDRISLEVLRGCTQGCRFCQAGMTTRPVRERTLDKVDDLLDRTLATTGYEEVSLVSLSTCDHSRVRQLVDNTAKKARAGRFAVSLPSLRLDSYSVELSDMAASERRTGITFAPEAASPRLRAVINKWIPDEELLEMSRGAYEKGWGHVKLYFMIGLPTERDDDIEAIADLCVRTIEHGRQANRKARVNMGVSTFVPKPFTPFQWAEQIGLDETVRKQDVLQRRLGRHPAIKFGRHDPEETFLEGLVSRADRRAADLLQRAFELGCRFDAWREHLRFDLWMQAVEETGYDVHDALRERDLDERLPWDHIDVLIPKRWFQDDWARAVELKHAQDCRHKRCHKCGVIDQERELCAHMLRNQIEGRKEEKTFERAPAEPFVEPPAVQRLWFRVARTGNGRFLSHLECMNAWIRTLRRAQTPLSYSQGHHPHPKVAFASATPVGQESTGDYMDVTLTERVDPIELLNKLRATCPQAFDVLAVREVDLRETSLMATAQGLRLTVFLPEDDPAVLGQKVQALLDAEQIPVERRGKTRSKARGGRGKRGKRAVVWSTVDVRPMIHHLALREGEVPALEIDLVEHEGKAGKLREILPLLTDAPERARILKRETLIVRDGVVRGLSEGWGGLAGLERRAALAEHLA
ncbi:MAG: TIGR03960 family B12-binding radical SAM protein [Deltaproteobacteria bacterium]|nr:MAG: TIGR03960 family B12-binding radical SAM protein [Deltaproteobacteria bacterium]